MSYRIVITETAVNDMDNIYEYIAYHLKKYAYYDGRQLCCPVYAKQG